MTDDATDTRTPLLSWRIDIPLVNNRFMLWDFAKATLISGAGMWVLVAVMSLVFNGEPLFLPLTFVAAIMGLLLVLLVVSSLILLNRWGFTNTLYEQGVGYESGGREKRINRALTGVGFLALLSGSTGGLGSALIARSQEDGFYPWADVHRINAHAGPRVISLRNSWRVVYRLYCTTEDYEEVLAICSGKVAESASYRAAHPVVRPPLPWARWGTWALVCAGAFSAAMAWHGARDEEVEMLLLGAVVALLAGVVSGGGWRRVSGLFAACVGAWFTYVTVIEGMRPVLPDFVAAGLSSPAFYSGEEIPFALSVIGGAVVTAVGLWSTFAPRRATSPR